MNGVRRGCVRVAVAAAAALAVLAARDARAQSAQGAAAAQVLFEQAKALMREKKYAEACAKFAESNRLDAGIGTMLWLADCYEKNGQSASAWAQFVEAADVAGERHDDRQRVARERAAALEPTLAKLTIDVPRGSDMGGLEVTRDGAPVGRAVWGTPVPVDPGVHTVTARAPAHTTWQGRVTIDASSLAAVIKVPPLEPEHVEPRAAPAPPLSTPAPAGAPSIAPDAVRVVGAQQGSSGSGQRTAGLVVGGVGVVSAGVGTVLGFLAKSHLDDSNSNNHCFPDNRCDAYGTAARHQALDTAMASTAAFIAGGVLLAGGLALYVTAPGPRSSPPTRGVGLRARRGWELELRPLLGASAQGLAVHAEF
jgi:serine/threonine-protein kinase